MGKIKKKKYPLVPSTKLSISMGITPKEYLLRQRAIRFLVDKRLKIRNVASLLRTTPATIRSFFQDERFVKELDERVEMIDGIDNDYRVDQMKITLHHLYEELRKREILEEFGETSVREVHKMIIDTQKELRLDTPGGFTSKVGVADLGDLQDRYNKSLSGKLHRMKKVTKIKKKKMKSIDREAIEKDIYDNVEVGSP